MEQQANTPLKDLVDEVLRKIGRNLVLYQQFEQLLKVFVSLGNFSGYASDLENILKKQKARTQKQTMGNLVKQYIENTQPDYQVDATEPDDIQAPFLSFNMRFGYDSTFHESRKEALANMVSERNNLIHHLLPRLDTNSADSCEELSQELDKQSERIRSEIDGMQRTVEVLKQLRRRCGEFFMSKEGEEFFELMDFRHSLLVIWLCDFVNNNQRPDGWALMSLAGQYVSQQAPEEYSQMIKNHGCKSLKALIYKADIFDVYEEATSKGGIRLLYKLKPGWIYSDGQLSHTPQRGALH